jgi:outer membrane protein OmpA-like peptidoglycan-associated protein
MRSTRAALLATVLCLTAAASLAQSAPSNGGDFGLFTMPVGVSPRAGLLGVGVYAWKQQLIAGDLADEGIDQRYRLYSHWAGDVVLTLGLTNHWSLFATAGLDRYESRGGWQGGSINAIGFDSSFKVDQAQKVRIGSKYVFTSEDAPGLGIGIWVAANVPVESGVVDTTDPFPTSDKINSRRADWEWGAVATKGVFTGMVSYQLSGEQEQDVRVANRLRFGFGVDVPVAAGLHVIGEVDRTIFDGGDAPEPPYSMLNAGVRFWIGQTGMAVVGAVNMNIDQVVHLGWGPSPLGGIVGFTYTPFPPPPPPPVVVPQPAPATPAPVEEEKEAAPAVAPVPAPAPAPVAPPPPQPRTTRDEIFFDGTKTRLTNIAKAILDGIALRMKSDLNSTAVITGYTDNTGKEEANVAISQKRADAAKEYLVTRHGIDPNRITTAAKGSAEPEYDNATKEGREKNRRAVIVVTFLSGA